MPVISLEPLVQAIIGIVLIIFFFVMIGYTITIYVGASGRYRSAKERMTKLGHMERLARLRHRDLDAFAKELNILRAKKGKRGVPKTTLAKIQFNLMYSIDEG